MGFLKKALKKIKLRGVVKAVMGVGSLIPVVGQYVDKAKKLIDKTGLLEKKKNRAIQEGNEEAAMAYNAQIEQSREQLDAVNREHVESIPPEHQQSNVAARGPKLLDFLGGAAAGIGNMLVNHGSTQDAQAQITGSFFEGGASAWFKKNWGYLAGGGGLLIALFALLRGGRRGRSW